MNFILVQTNNQINKVISTINEGANVIFENCYENAEANGIASDTIDGIKTATQAELLKYAKRDFEIFKISFQKSF